MDLISFCDFDFHSEFGVITENTVTFYSSTFMATPPTFTLYGDTAGGPPVEYTWSRDGVVITNSSIKPVPQVRRGGRNISPTIIVNERNVNAFYQSTLKLLIDYLVYISTLSLIRLCSPVLTPASS